MSDAQTTPQSLPGEKHNRDMSNPGEMGAFLLALVIVAALATGFLLKGLAGVGLVMVMIVPMVYIALVLISIGR